MLLIDAVLAAVASCGWRAAAAVLAVAGCCAVESVRTGCDGKRACWLAWLGLACWLTDGWLDDERAAGWLAGGCVGDWGMGDGCVFGGRWYVLL